MGDPTLHFKDQLTGLLKAKEFQQVSLLVKDKSNEEYVKATAWDLLPHVLQGCRDNEEQYAHCSDILQHFSKIGNPKEMLIAFLEQTDYIKDDTYFKVLLIPLQTLLQNLPGKRGKSLEWTFNTLYNHVTRLPLPEQHNFEGEERKLMDLDSNVQRLNDVLMAYLSFLEPFVDEVSWEYCKSHEVHYMDRIIHQRNVLCKHILQMIGHPLAFLDLSHEETKAKSTSRICCEKIMIFLSKMQRNLFILYDLLPEDESKLDKYCYGHSENSEEEYKKNPIKYTPDNSIEILSKGTLSYTIFVEELGINSIPCIYTHIFIFESHLKCIIALLTRKENCILYKGLHLAKKLISLLPNEEFSTEYLDIREFMVFPNVLFPIMIYCPVQEYRHLSLSLFNQFFLKFKLKGRYNLLCFLLQCQKHIGVRSLLIHNYRSQLHQALLKQAVYNPFIGNGLINFLKDATKIPGGVETADLMKHCEEILEIVNFIRYLIIRDNVHSDGTGVWSYIRDLEDCYLRPLRKALDLSRAHYKLRLNEITDSKNTRKQIDVTLSVKGEISSDISPEQHTEILNSALVTFDLIESVLVILQESIDKHCDCMQRNSQ